MKKVYIVWVKDITLSVVRPCIGFVASSHDGAKKFLQDLGYKCCDDDLYYHPKGGSAMIDEIEVDKKWFLKG